MGEIWKDIPDYEGLYQVSNMGRIKSLANNRRKKERILVGCTNPKGYFIIQLNKSGVMKGFKRSLLVWDMFGDKPRNGRKLQVDHIDANKKNDRIDNLQLLTNRENAIKRYRQIGRKYNLPTGVYPNGNRYSAAIHLNGKSKYLGSFVSIGEAACAYRDAQVWVGHRG